MSRKTRKLIWSVPLVAALAVVGALALFVALAPNEASAQNVAVAPGQPLNLEAAAYAEGIPEEEIELTWDAPTDGGSSRNYRIDVSENGGYTWVALESDVRGTRYLNEGLDAAQTRDYRVFAVNQHGIGPVSDTISASTAASTAPDRPTELTATIEGGDVDPVLGEATTDAELTITLTWADPTDPPGAPVNGYMVEYSVDGSIWDPVSDVTKSPGKHAGLDANVTYQYRVAAVNSVGQSGWSSTASANTLRGAQPVALTGLRSAVTPTEPNVWLYWTPPADSKGDPVTGYEVQGRPVAVANAKLIGGFPATLAQLKLITGTNAGELTFVEGSAITAIDLAEYQTFEALAAGLVTNLGTVTYTGLRFVLTGDGATAIPIPSSANGNLAELLGWTKARGAVSQPAYACCADDAGWQTIKTDISRPSGEDIHQFLITVDDVKQNTTYGSRFIPNADWQFRIRALNRRAPAGALNAGKAADGIEDVALLWPVVPIAATPGADGALKRPERLTVTRSEEDNEGRTGLVLTWNKATTVKGSNVNPKNALAYRIEYSNTGPRDEGYDWKVLEDNYTPSDGDDDTQPEADAALSRQTKTDNHEVLMVTAENLAAGQTRHYRVFALTAVDTEIAVISWPSPQNLGRTADPLKPEPPQDLTAFPGGHTSIVLEWVAPDATNDDHDGSEEGPSVITHYVIESSDDEGKTWQELDDAVKGTSYEDKGLMPGQTRDYRVAAVNSSRGGQSVWSNTADETTIPAVLPNEPGGLVAEAYGQNAIKLCWNTQAEQPEDAPVTAYLIEYSADGTSGWVELAMVTDMTDDDDVHTIYTDGHELNGGDTRYYRVFAINLRGQSDQSDVANATTGPATVPDAPMASAMADSDTEITVTWGSPASDGGADITGYMVQRAYMGADNMMSAWMDVDPAHMGMDMMYMDTGLMSETKYYYRVAAMNSVGMGEYSDGMAMATTEATDTAPGVPTAVTAMETSDTEITVTWGSPASDGGADITGYMVQRAYMGADDMMTEWMDVDPAHTGMDMEYMDTGLMPETTYYYQVRAMNAVGTGDYSDGMAMATTEMVNQAPMASGTIPAQTVIAGAMKMVNAAMYFTDADMDDTLTYMAMSDMEMYATETVDDMVGMVTINGVAAGAATITVTATDSAGESATQTIMVTVEAADTDTSLQDIPDSSISVSNNASSSITVSWTGGDNADSLIVVAAELGSDPFTYERANVAGDAAKMTTITGLNSGSSYIIIVIALQGTSFQYGVLPSVTAN